MSWDIANIEARIEELYRRITGVLEGRYRPLDGVPFFRFLYPPEAETLVLQEFNLLARRLEANGYGARTISLAEILKEATASLLGAESFAELLDRARAYERRQSRREATRLLAEYLPEEVTRHLFSRLSADPAVRCAILPRKLCAAKWDRLTKTDKTLFTPSKKG